MQNIQDYFCVIFYIKIFYKKHVLQTQEKHNDGDVNSGKFSK